MTDIIITVFESDVYAVLLVKKVISKIVVVTLITALMVLANGGSRVLTVGSISNDTINKTITIDTCNNIYTIIIMEIKISSMVSKGLPHDFLLK